MKLTHVEFVRNHMSSGHISYHDTETGSKKIHVEALKIGKVNKSIPWWYDLNSHFDKHHVHIENTVNSKEWWIWEHGGDVRIRDEKPKSGEYTSGDKLCDSGGHISIEVTESGKVKSHYLFASELETTAKIQAAAAIISSANAPLIAEMVEALKAFKNTRQGKAILNGIKSIGPAGLEAQASQTNYAKEALQTPQLSPYDPSQNQIGLINSKGETLFALTFTIAASASGSVIAGVTGGVGGGIDSNLNWGLFEALGVTMGGQVGVEISEEIGLSLGNFSDQQGFGLSETISLTVDEGFYVCIGFSLEGELSSLSVGPAEGEEISISVGVGYSDIIYNGPPAG